MFIIFLNMYFILQKKNYDTFFDTFFIEGLATIDFGHESRRYLFKFYSLWRDVLQMGFLGNNKKVLRIATSDGKNKAQSG